MGTGIDNLGLDTISGGYSKYSSSVIDPNKEADNYMDFDSYLKVLAAQMSNQDFNNPMSDSEMLQQMSSYSMLEGIKNMTNQSNISYASSLVGKAVTVNNGEDYDTGMVESVVIQNSKPYLSINGSLYEWNKVTDICDVDIYKKLSSLIGREAEVSAKDSDGNAIKTSGKITNVLFIGGSALVVVDGSTAFPLSAITLKAENSGDSGESGGENADDGSTSSTGVVMEEAVANSDNTARSYTAQSDALFDELMSTIDAISGNVEKTAAASMNDVVYDDIVYYEGAVSVPDYAAGFFGKEASVEETLSIYDIPSVDGSKVDPLLGAPTNSTASASAASYTTSYAAQPYTSTYGSMPISNRDTYVTMTTGNFSDLVSRSIEQRASYILTDDQAYSAVASGQYTANFSRKYGLELFSPTRPGVSTADCDPHRLNAALYPEEAALADALGTRMYDIKFIHNNAVNSRIDTSSVIAQTISGAQVTEIGYSGIGRLGEVVTFKDGTQRVEALMNNGHSVWYKTSGRYTINQMCAENFPYVSSLTQDELSIRHYALKAKK